jgi:hypothetical protein
VGAKRFPEEKKYLSPFSARNGNKKEDVKMDGFWKSVHKHQIMI